MAISFAQAARIALATLLLFAEPLRAAQKPEKTKHLPRTVWNFDGGIFMETDGEVSANTCFRLAGRVFAKDFFDNLKRIDDDQGTTFIRGKEPLTEFPSVLKLLFVIHDLPCPSQLHGATDRQYLTREMMSKLHLTLFWKHGVDMRPANDFKTSFFSVKPVVPYAKNLAEKLPEKLEWAYELEIPSAGIPLTDSLVLVFRRDDGHIAARVAARL